MSLVAKLAVVVAAMLLLSPGPAQATQPPQVIDDGTGGVVYCAEDGSTPDCLVGDLGYEADYDSYSYWSFSADGTRCVPVSGKRKGTGWWVAFQVTACLRDGQVVNVYAPFVNGGSSAPWPLNWMYYNDWHIDLGPKIYASDGSFPSSGASVYVTFRVRICSFVNVQFVGCGITVYPYIWFNIFGNGNLHCWSDKGVIYGCKGYLGGAP